MRRVWKLPQNLGMRTPGLYTAMWPKTVMLLQLWSSLFPHLASLISVSAMLVTLVKILHTHTHSLSLSLDPFLPSLVYTWLHLVDRCLVTTEMPLVQKPSSFKISSSQTSETWLNSETISDLCTWEWDRVNESTNFLCKININGISCSLIWSRAEMSWNRISLTLQAQWQLWIKTTWKILTQQWQ